MKRIFLLTLLVLLSAVGLQRAQAQHLSVKSNLLYDATATINLGAEVALAQQWTFDLSGNYNGWKLSDDKFWKHYLVQPEVRYWLCDRSSGHFLGLHAHGGRYNFSNLDNGIRLFGTDFSQLSDHRFRGWFAGGGIGYGYAFILGERWNLELELGLGYAYTEYDKFECEEYGRRLLHDATHNYFGLTKLAITFVFHIF